MNRFNLINAILIFLACISGAFTNAGQTTSVTSDYKIVGYFPNWAMYRPKSFKVENIDPTLITHINYAFVNHDEAGNLILFDPWADIQYGQDWKTQKEYWGHFRYLNELKERNPKLKTLFSVGGWTLSNKFSAMAANKKARKHFVQECITFCEKYGFDGIDIDWEYPGYAEHNGHPEDILNFTLLLKELYAATKTHSPQLLLTIAAPAGPGHYKNIEINKIHNYVDWINLMCYDYSGPGWSSMTNHNAPLYASAIEDQSLNCSNSIEYYLSQGVPKEKLIMGMPMYGRSFSKVQSATNGLFAPYNGPGGGTDPHEAGMRFYYDIKANLLATYKRYWDDKTKTPWLYHASLKEFVSYDDPESLRAKCDYLKKKKLGGAMVWELSLDDWPTWSCMKAINLELKNSKDI